jgi:hypothetical protein
MNRATKSFKEIPSTAALIFASRNKSGGKSNVVRIKASSQQKHLCAITRPKIKQSNEDYRVNRRDSQFERCFLFERRPSIGRGGRGVSPMEYCSYLQPHGEQLQHPGSQEQESPHWQVLPAARLAGLRFFDWFLRFDFIVIYI